MSFQNEPTWLQSGVNGQMPAQWAGVDLPDGDRSWWQAVPIGSIYEYKPSETAAPRLYVKRAVEDRDDDWAVLGGVHVIQQRVGFADFTDGGGAAGTLALTETIPIRAWVLRAILTDLTGFTGDVSAVIIAGDGTDADRYNAGTPSIFTTAEAIDLGAPSGVQVHVLGKTITLTVTSGTDWGLVTAGAFTFRLYYLL